MLERIGDVSVQSLPVTVARTMGCGRVDVSGHLRCRMEIPLSAFKAIEKLLSPLEFLRFPPDAHRLDDTELGNVPAWYVLSGFCKCGHCRNVDMKRLRAKFPPSARTDDFSAKS
ncbi:hypothetical protein EFQ99_16410 [Rhizobium vallis]|uniref:Uncharacterized protein n=1 Tax=Rhizobium vallis TaxID=634290 RepID=A0A432PJ07_9HYPH|nr:hypothetical protein EFQ99_16410 [Rhizobium vallis]